MLLLGIFLFIASITGQVVENTTSPSGYTNYQETSTDNCTGSTSICIQELPFNISNPPDVWLDARVTVPAIQLRIDNLQARLNLDARVASLINLNAGVDYSIDKVNLTITGVKAQVQLVVYLDNIAKIVTQIMASLDLNPLLTSVVNGVFQTVNNLLAGNIVNQVLGTTGKVLSSVVVGNYQQNMTFTGVTETLSNGNIIKQYNYPPPASPSQTDNILVNVVFNSLGNPLSATVVNPPSTPITTSGTATVTSASPTITTTAAVA